MNNRHTRQQWDIITEDMLISSAQSIIQEGAEIGATTKILADRGQANYGAVRIRLSRFIQILRFQPELIDAIRNKTLTLNTAYEKVRRPSKQGDGSRHIGRARSNVPLNARIARTLTGLQYRAEMLTICGPILDASLERQLHDVVKTLLAIRRKFKELRARTDGKKKGRESSSQLSIAAGVDTSSGGSG